MAKTTASKKPAPARKAPAARKAAAAPKSAKPAVARARAATRINTDNVSEGTIMMKNETKAVADRVQEMFGDVNERARTQIERNTRVAEEVTELTKGNVEALVASTKVAAKGIETIGQEVADRPVPPAERVRPHPVRQHRRRELEDERSDDQAGRRSVRADLQPLLGRCRPREEPGRVTR